jgi:5-(hydroxymethyl)furfural/furfural oxidase
MFMVVVAKSAWHPIGLRLGSLFSWINKPYSSGSLKLNPSDPAGYPDVAFEMLSDPRDMARMKLAVRKMSAFYLSDALKAAADHPFAATHGAMAALVGQINLRNWLMTIGPAMLTDGPSKLRDTVINRLFAAGGDLGTALRDDDAMTELVRKHTVVGWHPSGTCKMGTQDDPMAVVSQLDGACTISKISSSSTHR